jgi:hypothetical protein
MKAVTVAARYPLVVIVPRAEVAAVTGEDVAQGPHFGLAAFPRPGGIRGAERSEMCHGRPARAGAWPGRPWHVLYALRSRKRRSNDF